METVSARDLALPLYAFLSVLSESSPHERLSAVRAYLLEHRLRGHLVAELKTVQDGQVFVTLGPMTEHGHEILGEVLELYALTPCDPAAHDFSSGSVCKWCGSMKD